MGNIGEIFVYFMLIAFSISAVYAAAKGFLHEDVEREKKWAEYEHRNRKDKL